MNTNNSNYAGGYGLGFGDLNGTNTSWYYANILTEANQYGAIFSTSFYGLGLTATNFATFSGLISNATKGVF